jgi:hypothetical protein
VKGKEVMLFSNKSSNVSLFSLTIVSSSMLGQIGRQANVFTFGYGGEHDADLLRAVSEAGHGLFYYIDNADSIPESFCDCLGGLLSVSAQVYKSLS